MLPASAVINVVYWYCCNTTL